jgi:type VI secretion system secreted protein VgrG
LNIGYLIRQNGNVRSSYRGIGLELATDAWSTLRAKRGIFISTAQRNGAVSTQLDTNETQEKLKAADQLATALSDASVQHQAFALTTPQGIQQLTKAIGGSESADGQQAPKFDQPVVLIDSQAAINAATPASTVMFAGQDMSMTAASAMRVTGGQSVSLAVAKAASLFTHAGGAKVIAAKEPVSLQAHTGPMDVLADKAITITSSNANIKVQAKHEILLTSGGGYIKLAGANIDIHCPSSVSVKGASHSFLGAQSKAANLPSLPDTRVKLFDEAFVIKARDSGELLTHHPYRIKRADGTYENGITDENGQTHVVHTVNAERLILEVLTN